MTGLWLQWEGTGTLTHPWGSGTHLRCWSGPADEQLDLDDGRWEDIHVVTGALKLFFRELPEPLVPFSHFDKFIAAISEAWRQEREWDGRGIGMEMEMDMEMGWR